MTNNLKQRNTLFTGGAVKERLLGLGSTLNGMLKVKLGRPFLKVLFLLPPVVGIKRNLSLVKVLITFLAHVHRLSKASGLKFTVIYLKTCHTLLQQALGGQRLSDTGPLGARVTRTRNSSRGLPRIIPSLHRIRIRNGELAIIRLWLSLFSIYRVIDIKGKMKLSTITAPFSGQFKIIDEMIPFLKYFWAGLGDLLHWRSHPILDAILEKGIMTFLPSLKAKPELMSKSAPVVTDASLVARIASTSPLSILLSARTWTSILKTTELGEAFASWCRITKNSWLLYLIEVCSRGEPDPRANTAMNRDGKLVTLDDESYRRTLARKGRYRNKLLNLSWRQILGKLGTKIEAAGKVRVFAMVDPFTQWILRPLHDAIFSLLRFVPQDGTHNQVKPLVRLLERRARLVRENRPPGERSPGRNKVLPKKTWALFSYDLTAATDRLPVAFQEEILVPFLGRWLAGCWTMILTYRDYWVSLKEDPADPTPTMTPLRYAVGQPMGALSSWAMLALTHHCIVQWAWYRVCNREQRKWSWYREYAVLGDDICILGHKVAGAYVDLMHSLGVGIGMHKSLVSIDGTAVEFAKRTFYKGKDVSAVSLKELLVAKRNLSAGMELCRRYNLSLGAYCKFLGYGYKRLGSLTMRLWSMPSRLRNYIVAYTGPGMPSFRDLVSWLSQKSILSSYLKTELALSKLWDTFVQVEKERLLSHLEEVEEQYRRANIATQQYREGGKLIVCGVVYDNFPWHPGIKGVEAEDLDFMNQTVYRESFIGGLTRLHEIRNQVAEIGTDREVDIMALWNLVDELDDSSSLIPGMANVSSIPKEKSLGVGLALVDRWIKYSRSFRSTTKGSSAPS
jgi:hypothetical protein